jgi:hypothetical protein
MPDARATAVAPAATPSDGRAALRLPLASSGHRETEVGPWRPLLIAVLAAVGASFDVPYRALWAAVALFWGVCTLWLWQAARTREAKAPGWLVIDDEQIARLRPPTRSDPRGRTSLARWDAPFGVSVLANMARSRALLAFTTPSATRFLGLELETGRDADLARHLLDRAVTVPDADLELAVGPAPDVLLGASAARLLLEELEARGPESLRRLYLSDARGGAIAVEQDTLAIGDGTFDLAAPVEWRVFTFQEGDPGVAALYQATSIRQGAFEVVLVCRAPEELASWSVGRPSDAPPARETRVAIDRLFMTPLRAVLEQAPRLSRPGAPPSRDRGRAVQT